MIVGFTGHRPIKIGVFEPKVRQDLMELLLELKPTEAVTGMALGFDQWAAGACLIREIPFIAAVPFEGQEVRWPVLARRAYDVLLNCAVRVEVVSPGPYASWKFQRRNEWIVDHCDLLIAAWDGSDGGTANCVKYAQSVKREIRRLSW